MKTEVDEKELVRQAQRGEQEAFAALVVRHQRLVYNLAYRLLRDGREAEDLSQEAFLRAWQGLPKFRGEAKFSTWLYRIVSNLCYNRMSGLRRQLRELAIEDDESLALALPAGSEPAKQMEAAQQRQLLHQQIAALPTKYQMVISLYYLQQFSYQEISEVLELPLGTVKTHLFRARHKLKQQLEAAAGQ